MNASSTRLPRARLSILAAEGSLVEIKTGLLSELERNGIAQAVLTELKLGQLGVAADHAGGGREPFGLRRAKARAVTIARGESAWESASRIMPSRRLIPIVEN